MNWYWQTVSVFCLAGLIWWGISGMREVARQNRRWEVDKLQRCGHCGSKDMDMVGMGIARCGECKKLCN